MNHIKLPISKNMFTIIDVDDYERSVKNNLTKWNSQKCYKKFYVSRNFKNKKIYLHRYIMNCPDGFCIDHINGDSLDNRKKNLRICSFRENARNVKKENFKGVVKTKNNKYRAQIAKDGVHIDLGTFSVESEAARVYDLAAAFLFKEYASFNFEFSRKFLKILR